MLVIVRVDNCGNLTARPVSERHARRFARRVAANGGATFEVQERDGFTAFFQDGMGAQEFLADLPSRHRRALEEGYPVRMRVDGWIVGHWYGYDAHTVCESR